MSNPLRRRLLIAGGVVASLVLTVAVARGGEAKPRPAVAAGKAWVGTWANAQTAAGKGLTGRGFDNQTIRMVVRTSVGGSAVRVRFSNVFGTRPLTIGRATVAHPLAEDSPAIDPASLHELTFNGQSQVTVPKGGQVLSDPVAMTVPAMKELTVSMFVPVPSGPATFHLTSRETAFVGAGDQSASREFTVTTTREYWFYLAGVDVETDHAAGSVVTLGDSITDGNGSTLGLHRRWPDYLANRLAEDTSQPADPGVLNLGLAGNAISHDGSEAGFAELGVSAPARLYRDTVGQTGAHTVILALGMNDIQLYNDPPGRIIDGLRQLAVQLKQLGLRLVVCTITPFEGFNSWTPAKENTRQAVNAYIRDSDLFDAVVDFDAVLRDPAKPTKLPKEFDSGDHIHPNDAGAEKMAEAVPLDLLQPPAGWTAPAERS
ncbi:MAG TPA: SGNH/GDSL hydrolase family protein [Micromonospora sp.]